jgi:hypothetical protein
MAYNEANTIFVSNEITSFFRTPHSEHPWSFHKGTKDFITMNNLQIITLNFNLKNTAVKCLLFL